MLLFNNHFLWPYVPSTVQLPPFYVYFITFSVTGQMNKCFIPSLLKHLHVHLR